MNTNLRALSAGLLAAGTLGLAASSASAAITPIATFDHPGTLAAGGGWIALTQATPSGAQLLVGKVGTVPKVVDSAVEVPSWARPHIGTTKQGKPIIIFPAQSASGVDLNSYDPATGVVATVPGAYRDGVNEVEGDMDRGNLAFAVAPGKLPTLETVIAPTLTLNYKPAGGSARTLTRQGGIELDLAGGKVISVRSVLGQPDLGGGECGVALIEVTSLTGSRTRVAKVGCGEAFQRVAFTSFLGANQVVWGVDASGSTTFSVASVKGGKSKKLSARGEIISAAPTGPRSAIVLEGDDSFGYAQHGLAHVEGKYTLASVTDIK